MGAAALTVVLAAMVSSSSSSFLGVHCFASRSFLPRHTSSAGGMVRESSTSTLLEVARGGAFSTSGLRELLSMPSSTIFRRSGRQTMAASTTTTDVTEGSASSSAAMTPAEKLEALRAKMKELNLDVYIIPSDDPHLSGE